jgi:hypothetical protein
MVTDRDAPQAPAAAHGLARSQRFVQLTAGGAGVWVSLLEAVEVEDARAPLSPSHAGCLVGTRRGPDENHELVVWQPATIREHDDGPGGIDVVDLTQHEVDSCTQVARGVVHDLVRPCRFPRLNSRCIVRCGSWGPIWTPSQRPRTPPKERGPRPRSGRQPACTATCSSSSRRLGQRSSCSQRERGAVNDPAPWCGRERAGCGDQVSELMQERHVRHNGTCDEIQRGAPAGILRFGSLCEQRDRFDEQSLGLRRGEHRMHPAPVDRPRGLRRQRCNNRHVGDRVHGSSFVRWMDLQLVPRLSTLKVPVEHRCHEGRKARHQG